MPEPERRAHEARVPFKVYLSLLGTGPLDGGLSLETSLDQSKAGPPMNRLVQLGCL